MATITALVCWALFFIAAVRKFSHVLQAERYHTNAYLGWALKGGGARVYMTGKYEGAVHLFALASFAMLPRFPREASWALAVCALAWAAPNLRPEKNAKKPLVYTARVKRLFIAVLVIYAVPLAVAWTAMGRDALILCVVALGYLAPLLVAGGNIATSPVEMALQSGFKREARKRLKGKTVVAITGSYGKTGTKEAVAHLLETSFPLLKTPGSFNTPMGLCKVINDSLEPGHEMFVTEMGATRKGDIRELCEIAPPSVGIITSVGTAHFETFGSEGNVAKAKFELADALPPDGLLIYNADYPLAREKAKGRPQKTVTYSLDHPADFTPLNIRCDENGSTFDIKTPTGLVEGVRIRPLGRLNALNVTAAFAVGAHFKIPLDRLARSAATLAQTPARMELLENPGSYLIINDGFNSNPVGAASALETLSLFTGRKKFLVTPGLVDLGEMHDLANFEFGKKAAGHCDWVLLVNERRTRPIYDGLLSAGFDSERLRVFPSLASARAFLDKTADKNGVALFENDLPDHMETF
ncbi:MAG: UDP-N-acetylmuramoyl-tripeptide--D-alanyl-D-alanine ligase [Nitrospinae bacterium]|nr:UDP-N-acetylmuramoyl-tripeptide--D-alanyl-D-alanine ligase [Nitrospinota bacterium]